jgi:hypothetical protein
MNYMMVVERETNNTRDKQPFTNLQLTKDKKNMKVYHSSNVKIDVLKIGSNVTPNKEISKVFGSCKPCLDGKFYCHVFEVAGERRHPYVFDEKIGRMILDLNNLVGDLDRDITPDGEDWANYTTAVELKPIEIIEY